MALTQESWRSSFLLVLDNDLLFTKISPIALPDKKLSHPYIYYVSCIMYIAWTRVATSEHPVEVDPTDLIIVFKMMPIINILTT